MNNEATIPHHTEFETKYKVESLDLFEFKRIASSLEGLKKYIYVEGPDYYYVDSEGSFARYRKPSHDLDGGRSEVTWKIKPKGAKNNIIRKEYNWNVTGTPEDTIKESLTDNGYTFNFSVDKQCHIYNFEEATLVFYSVCDTTDGRSTKVDSYCEIEIKEETIHNLTENQAWEIIEKYEKALEPIGISPQKRMRRSLFEIYYRESK